MNYRSFSFLFLSGIFFVQNVFAMENLNDLKNKLKEQNKKLDRQKKISMHIQNKNYLKNKKKNTAIEKILRPAKLIYGKLKNLFKKSSTQNTRLLGYSLYEERVIEGKIHLIRKKIKGSKFLLNCKNHFFEKKTNSTINLSEKNTEKYWTFIFHLVNNIKVRNIDIDLDESIHYTNKILPTKKYFDYIKNDYERVILRFKEKNRSCDKPQTFFEWLINLKCSKRKDETKKTWKFPHNFSLEQFGLCAALQEKFSENNLSVKIANYDEAYNVFCSLPFKKQEKIEREFKIVKLPFLKSKMNYCINHHFKTAMNYCINHHFKTARMLGLTTAIVTSPWWGKKLVNGIKDITNNFSNPYDYDR